jgi:HSP20 family protein
MLGTMLDFEGGLFDEFSRMEREMDELFGQWPWPMGLRATARGAFPAVNVGSTPDQLEVYLFVPGVDPQSLDISIQQNLLTVSGERRQPAEENATFYRKERFEGEFRRIITLPDDVDPERVDAHCRDGILRVTVQRREAAKPRQIEIH